MMPGRSISVRLITLGEWIFRMIGRSDTQIPSPVSRIVSRSDLVANRVEVVVLLTLLVEKLAVVFVLTMKRNYHHGSSRRR